ncbi:MAG: hypothetical protein RL215_1131 [Planctomycetota bacterium]|jgi:carbon storage regulator
MLVLSRKVGESIQISPDIRITVTQVRGGRVRLSIEAPPSIRIARQEILVESKIPATASEIDPAQVATE